MAAWCRRTLIFASLILTMSIGNLPTVASAQEPKPLTLTIDYGDGMQKRFTAIAWREGITIADLLDQAARHPRGIKYVKRGSGATSLLMQIDDVKNGSDDKYWIYDVNGRQGDRSYATVKLKAGDSVLWRFDLYQ